MSFLGEPFKHDLFISYSHGGFASGPELTLWSQRFAEDLRAELAGTPEFEGISVFSDESKRSDESVDRTEQLTRLLRDRIASSALFTLLMTPQYLRSRWCRQELEWWSEKNLPDTFGAGQRIFVCKVLPTDVADWPTELPELVGYLAYDQDQGQARPFAWPGSKRDLDDYRDLLVDLAGDMMHRLRAIKAILDERRRQEEQAKRYAAASGQVLFLHGRPDAATAWEQACERLQDSGFFVVPDKPVPLAANGGLETEYQTQLATSDGVLLLGTEDGPGIDTDIVVIGRNYRNLVAATGAFLPCAVLNMVGDSLKTERRVRNVRNLRMGWIDATRGDWPREVRSWLLEASGAMEMVA